MALDPQEKVENHLSWAMECNRDHKDIGTTKKKVGDLESTVYGGKDNPGAGLEKEIQGS